MTMLKIKMKELPLPAHKPADDMQEDAQDKGADESAENEAGDDGDEYGQNGEDGKDGKDGEDGLLDKDHLEAILPEIPDQDLLDECKKRGLKL